MKKIFYSIIAFLIIFWTNTVHANDDTSIVGISNKDLRKGNISIDSIPVMIAALIEVIIWLAGTISIVLLIYYAIQMQINSGITGDSGDASKSKKWMIAAGVGFLISVTAWFSVTWLFSVLNIAL